MFECDNCEAKFRDRVFLKVHSESCVIGESGSLQCQTCKEIFENFVQLANHYKKLHYKEPQLFDCEKCNKKFGSKLGLNRHPCSLSENETEESESDEEMFDQKMYLTDENRERAAKDEKFRIALVKNFTCLPCTFCPQLFFTRELMEKHAEKEHSKIRSAAL